MITVEDIMQKVDESQEEAIRCLVEAIQSPSPTGRELPMAKTMGRWLDKLGIQVDTYEYQKDRPNYIATWKGTQPGKTFLFNGHMDVFPATETEDSGYNAWSGEVKDGCVYGRGTSDMKGGDCAALMAVKLLKEMGFDPKGSVVLNYVSDEESGGKYGILSLLEQNLIHADFGISMEPSCPDEETIDLMMGHGGVYPCQVIVYGDGGHAVRDIDPNDKDNHYGGEDAIKKAMKAVAALNRLAERIAEKPETPFGKSHLAVTKLNAGIAVNNYPRRAAESPGTLRKWAAATWPISKRPSAGITPGSAPAPIILPVPTSGCPFKTISTASRSIWPPWCRCWAERPQSRKSKF